MYKTFLANLHCSTSLAVAPQKLDVGTIPFKLCLFRFCFVLWGGEIPNDQLPWPIWSKAPIFDDVLGDSVSSSPFLGANRRVRTDG